MRMHQAIEHSTIVREQSISLREASCIARQVFAERRQVWAESRHAYPAKAEHEHFMDTLKATRSLTKRTIADCCCLRAQDLARCPQCRLACRDYPFDARDFPRSHALDIH